MILVHTSPLLNTRFNAFLCNMMSWFGVQKNRLEKTHVYA